MYSKSTIKYGKTIIVNQHTETTENVSVMYNDTQIASLGPGASKIINTAGTFCTGNISVGTKVLNTANCFVGQDFSCSVVGIVGDKPTNFTPSATYTGSVITNGYTTPANVTMTGNNSGTEIGTYTVTYTPNNSYCWSDGTANAVTIALTINEFPGLKFTANAAGSTVAMSVTGTPTLGQNFQTSTDGINWTEFTPGTTTITLTNVGDKVYFKGNNPNGVSERSSIYYSFVMTGSIAGSGNIMSLIDNGACNALIIPNARCFYRMFRNCEALTTAPALPATTLAESCYAYTFEDCISLTTAPALPATTLVEDCYICMFYNCTSLIVSDTAGTGYSRAWRIPASGTFTGTYVQFSMFSNCATGSGRSSNIMPGAAGKSYTYYTQNTPV